MIYASVHDMLINNGLAISRKRLLRSASIRLHASTEAPENSYTCPLKRQKIPLSPLLIASYAAVSCFVARGLAAREPLLHRYFASLLDFRHLAGYDRWPRPLQRQIGADRRPSESRPTQAWRSDSWRR
jgi:hypothetical protein